MTLEAFSRFVSKQLRSTAVCYAEELIVGYAKYRRRSCNIAYALGFSSFWFTDFPTFVNGMSYSMCWNSLDFQNCDFSKRVGSMVISSEVLEYTYALHIMVAFKRLPGRFPL